MASTVGTVFAIEEFSVYDGPGIRTTVFLKGCPLRCTWCHNPEGQLKDPEIIRGIGGCTGCGKCESAAIKHEGRIEYTKESMALCKRGLLRECGVKYTPGALAEKLMKNARFLNTGGGVTFSGGEPLSSWDFIREVIENLSGKLHVAIQTSGYCKDEVFQSALELCDFFLFDLKIASGEMHEKYTGVTNEQILKNFKALTESGKDFIVRIPLIPTVTDTVENITALAKILHGVGVKYAELLPYNKMAGGKYRSVGRIYEPRFDETEEPVIRSEIFDSYGIKVKIL